MVKRIFSREAQFILTAHAPNSFRAKFFAEESARGIRPLRLQLNTKVEFKLTLKQETFWGQ
jgi:hypothetical protein